MIRPTRDLAPPSDEGSADDCGVMCTFLKELLEGHLKVDMVVSMMMMTDDYCDNDDDNDDCGVMCTIQKVDIIMMILNNMPRVYFIIV